ncbi:M16 family metallopeptidase [Methylophaga sp. OBS3]|uniref:M16 family metallopeptidase n=1 Tax=Methylophaga sp. OBS3 TaxID=2991934 RepID=UPI002253B329|nr:pitrilysin family protein [Methylophaga sp. OBS3]MCX4190118.1 insulinase family protein [Methylophaga sp. OBS3]
MFAKLIGFFTLLLATFSSFATPNIAHWQTQQETNVYFVDAPQLPMVDIRLLFDAGGARDGDLPGTALLTNAMLDEGTTSANTDEIAAAFDDVGAKFSSESVRDMAVLSLRTLVEEKAMNQAVDMFIDVSSQPVFPEASFARLKNQMKTGLQAQKQSPEAIAERAFYEALYGQHPYAKMPSGNEESLEKIEIADLKAFFNKYYVAQNAVLVIVGDLRESEAKALSEKISSALNKGKAAPEVPAVTALQEAAEKQINFPSSQSHLLVGQPGVTRTDADYFPLYVGNHVLGGGGLVSIINDEIREKRGLSYSAYSYFRPMREAGPFQMGLQTRNEQAEEALMVLRQTLRDFVKDGPTDEQLEAAKQNITGGFALRLDSNSKIADYLGVIGFYQLPLDYLDNFKQRVNAVTKAEIKDAFTRRVQPDKMITVIVGGKGENK